jgi:hypothetical protein
MLLGDTGLRPHLSEFSVTAVTFNLTIFDEAIGEERAHDAEHGRAKRRDAP